MVMKLSKPKISQAPEDVDNGGKQVQQYKISGRKRTVVLEFSTDTAEQRVAAVEPNQGHPPRPPIRTKKLAGERKARSKSRIRKLAITRRSKSRTRGRKKNLKKSGVPRPGQGIEDPDSKAKHFRSNSSPPSKTGKGVTMNGKSPSFGYLPSRAGTKSKGDLEGLYIQIKDDKSQAVKSGYDPRGEIDYESFGLRPQDKMKDNMEIGDDDWVNFNANGNIFEKVQCRAYIAPKLCACQEEDKDGSRVTALSAKPLKVVSEKDTVNSKITSLSNHQDEKNKKNEKNFSQCKPSLQCYGNNNSIRTIESAPTIGESVAGDSFQSLGEMSGEKKSRCKSTAASACNGSEARQDTPSIQKDIASKLPRTDSDYSSHVNDYDNESEVDSGILSEGDSGFSSESDSGIVSDSETLVSNRLGTNGIWLKRALCMKFCHDGNDVDNEYQFGNNEEIEPEPERNIIQPKSSNVETKVIETAEPTVLYAAIGSQNWNTAICRLMEVPDEASVWVDTGSVDEESAIQFLPLHIACLSAAPLLLVTLLVQTYPVAIGERSMGKLPIHMACDSQADHRVVFLLLNSLPASLHAIDDEENTPVEVASLTDPSAERAKIIQVLTHRMDNEVVTIPTALYAAIDSHDWNYAIRRIVEMPQEATTWVSFTKSKTEIRFLPLHAACLLGAPFLLVSDLIQAYPFAVRKKTMQGKLPLHIASASHGDCRVVSLLLEHWADALHVKDSDGNTPMDSATQSDMNSERKKILAVLSKKLGSKVHRVEFSPTELYSLIEAKEWDAAVKRLLEAPKEGSTWVGSCIKKENAKFLPLHLACKLRAPLLLVAVLIQTYPNGIQKRTKSGKLPIHYACERHADHRVVSLLLHSWPDSFSVKDSRENTCVQSALLSKNSPERTKILETLMTFESRFKDPASMPTFTDTIKKYAEDEKEAALAAIPGYQDKKKEKNEASQNTEIVKKVGLKPKKKHLFLKRKKRNGDLWANDKAMFEDQ